MAASRQFRETLWFKKGTLDSAPAADGPEARPVDTLPVEDRYLDDGTVTREDSQMFSVRTGSTQFVPRIVETVSLPHDGLPVLVSEMKRGRRAMLAVIGAAVAAACVIIAVYVA